MVGPFMNRQQTGCKRPYPHVVWATFISAFITQENVLVYACFVILSSFCQLLLSLDCSVISCHVVMCLWHIHYTSLEIRNDY